ncbi:hypothetical protein BRD17_00035 [Halobacteriales archaeon SW_7_68_16]|nr:MAG: hypothetical protein BRD17_00035 [Halobacteriales archaeon SW_7_68_16]
MATDPDVEEQCDPDADHDPALSALLARDDGSEYATVRQSRIQGTDLRITERRIDIGDTVTLMGRSDGDRIRADRIGKTNAWEVLTSFAAAAFLIAFGAFLASSFAIVALPAWRQVL